MTCKGVVVLPRSCCMFFLQASLWVGRPHIFSSKISPDMFVFQ
jgi:hypothetical protein